MSSSEDDDFQDIKTFFSSTEWSQLVKCEKVRYRNVRRNHRAMLAIGLNSPVPAFMRRGRHQLQASDSEEEEWTPRLESRGRTASRSCRSPPRKSVARKRESHPDKAATKKDGHGEVRLCTSEGGAFAQGGGKDTPAINEGGATQIHLKPTASGLSEKRECLERQTLPLNRYQRGKSLRDRPRMAYTEQEEQKDDHYFYCDNCRDFFVEQCEVHGPPVFVPDNPASGGASDRARLTLPPGLEVRTSGIPAAGLGVFNQGNTVAAGTHYGPYEGERIEKDQAMESGYSWVIYRNTLCEEYIDAEKETHSNWMRYVNCARNEEEQNLVAFQYRGGILYRSCKPIHAGEELLVWYGDEYARDLGIVFDYLWDKKSSAKESFQIFSCFGCPFSFTSLIFLHKHIKRSHQEEYVRLLKSGDIRSERSLQLPADLENLCAVLTSELTAAITSQLKAAIDTDLVPIAASLEGFTAKFEAQDRRIVELEQHLNVYSDSITSIEKTVKDLATLT
ncbi:hypothetical protein UPYG_G00051910 [Umbra pygmaea]|uniref:Histone-lysine N-methyltransferase PRDM9 n=1 Tax=Umbra pygmaea TaxID=75934 RepID=A0ABD0XAI0_UMBPY